jgi:hypothetical protein
VSAGPPTLCALTDVSPGPTAVITPFGSTVATVVSPDAQVRGAASTSVLSAASARARTLTVSPIARTSRDGVTTTNSIAGGRARLAQPPPRVFVQHEGEAVPLDQRQYALVREHPRLHHPYELVERVRLLLLRAEIRHSSRTQDEREDQDRAGIPVRHAGGSSLRIVFRNLRSIYGQRG